MLVLMSPDFNPGGIIPRRFTCDGENLSPAFAWSGVPAGTKEFLLACDDPDAPHGVFHHWLICGLPPDLRALPPGFGKAKLEPGLHEAVNDFGKPGYGGPCPPRGDRPHRYHFELCALRGRLPAPTRGTRCVELMEAARPLLIECAELIGNYGRP